MKNQQLYIEKTLELITQTGDENFHNDFLHKAVKHLDELFSVDYVLICNYSIKNLKDVKTEIIYNKGTFLPNTEYQLVNTPCEKVINNGVCTYKNNLQSIFPKGKLLKQMNANSYIGIPLFGTKGQPIGLMSILDSKPKENTETIELVLKMLAIKVSQILEINLFEAIFKSQIKDLKELNTKTKESEKKIIESEEKFSKAFYSHPTAMQIVNFVTGDRIDVNESYLRLFEYNSEAEYLKGNIFENSLLLNAEIVSENNKKLLKNGFFKNSNFDIKTINGKLKNLIVSGTKLDIGDGNLAILSFIDVTNQFKTEEKFRKLSNLTFEGILIHDNGIVIDINRSFLNMFGYLKEELIGQNIIDFLFPNKYHKLIFKSIDKKYTRPYEIRGIRKNGSTFPIEVEAREINLEGSETYRVAALRDITDRKKAEQESKKLHVAVEQSANTIIITDTKANIEYVNPKFTDITGYTAQEVIGKNPSILSSGNQSKQYYSEMWKIISNGEIWKGEFQNKSKCGNLFWEQVTITPIKNEFGEIINYLAVKEDITDRKKAEEKLVESEKKFRELYEKSGDAVLIIENGLFTDCNKATIEMLNYERKLDFLKVHPSKLSPKIQPDGINSKEKANKMMELALEKGTHRFEWTHTRKNGEEFPVEVLLTVISNESKNEVIHCVWRDITNRKRADLKLNKAFETIKEKEDYLSNILKITNEGFWTINTEALTLEVNPEMCKILGYPKSEIIGKSIFEFVNDENKKIFNVQMLNREKGLSSTYEIELNKSNGEKIPCLFKTAPIYDKRNNRLGSFAMVTDISDLKKAYEMSENQNQELRKLSYELSQNNNLLLESTTQFKNLFEQSPVSIWEQDFSEVINLLNKKRKENPNFKKYLRQNKDFIKECISKIKVLNVNKATLELLKVKDQNELVSHIRKTNSKRSVDAIRKELLTFALGANEFIGETEFLRTDGKLVSVIIKSTLIESTNKVIATITDISALKKAKEKAEEADRLKTEFLNNMSHEIRTPLNGILGFSQMLNEPGLESNKRNNFVGIIQNSGNQLLNIIDDILEISRLGTKQVKVLEEEVCLNDVLLEMFSIFDLKAKENKTPLYLKKELSNNESTILTDRTKLNKILSNLLENALKFTRDGFIEFGYKLKNNKLKIYVKDTGIGIKEEHKKLIFKRFSQAEKEISKKVGGLGLGLSIAKENAELLGGKISVKSKINEGSIFYVSIPFIPVYSDSDIIIEDSKSKQTFLITDDEEVNYLYLETLLKDILKINCNIIHAKNGKEAVDYCKKNNAIDLVLMDLKMPILNGFKATSEIREFRPNIPIIAQTSYSTLKDRDRAMEAGCNEFISKPINKESLLNVLERFVYQK